MTHWRARPEWDRPEGSQAGGGAGWGGAKGKGEATLTGGPGLPSKPEAPWTKGTV